jgi:cell division protein FtsI/penicillin-binding protein 2
VTSSDEKSSRFLTLRLAMLALGLILAARVVQVQVVQHEKYKDLAERQWTEDISLPAERGNMFDRHGRPLALSVSRWQVGVARSLVTDADALAGLLAPVLDLNQATIRKKITGVKGHVVLGKNVVLSREEKLNLELQRAVTLQDLRSRIYPFGTVGASLVGFFRHDPKKTVATGLELGLNDHLAGVPGQARKIMSGRRQEELGQVVLQQAQHGRSLVLTVDADLQAICEQRLAETVTRFNAEGGSVLITDPWTGDILAAASWPLLESRQGSYADQALWKNRNFTHCFEPGSVFKIFSTASLLRNGAIDTSSTFNCSDGDFVSFTMGNDDDHKYGDLSLMPAFSISSNIYFARAVGNLSNDEFYRDLVDFGFGQKTTLPYPGQAAGILHNPTSWSGRSRPTIAIGQEVAVTAVQLAMAVGAVANGGTLYAPRLVSEVRGEKGEMLEAMPEVPLRRIMSEPLAALLREAMRRVVTDGTGQKARNDWISAGGKTGTAQKACGDAGYTPGAYVASFAGLLPVEDPRLVILTVVDQPRGFRKYYAAQSALPLFCEVVSDIRQSTDWLDDVPGGRTAPMPPLEKMATVTVPDVLHLTADRAVGRLSRAGLQTTGTETRGVVVQQIPAAGSRVPAGQRVHLTVAARAPMAGAPVAVCPDFTGLSNRQVRSLAARLGVTLDLAGTGYAVGQNPAPGSALTDNRVSVRLEASWR